MNIIIVVVVSIIILLLIFYYIKLNEINSFLKKNIEKLENLEILNFKTNFNNTDKYIEKLTNFVNDNKDGIYRFEETIETEKIINYFSTNGYVIKEIDSEQELKELKEQQKQKEIVNELFYLIKEKWDVKRKFLITKEDDFIIPEGLLKIKNTDYELINTSKNIKIIKIIK
jgi:hypothetical protein